MFGAITVVDSIRVQNYDVAFALRPGGERCVAFLHGLGCSKTSFQKAFDGHFFSKQFTLLAPDLIGHGDSSKPDDFSYALEQQSHLLLGLLNKLAIKQVAIVAHSMGNVPGLLLTQEKLDLFGYFSLEGNMCLADCGVSARVARYSEDNFVNKMFPLASKQFHCGSLDDEDAASPIAFYRSARSLVEWSSSKRLLPLYRGLTVQKAYLYGSKSKMNDCIADFPLKGSIEIPEAGHFLMIDNPALTYGAIVEILEDC